jgi:hypothetical protein
MSERGYALDSVATDGGTRYVFTREDGSVRPAVRSTQSAATAAVTRYAVVFPIALS